MNEQTTNLLRHFFVAKEKLLITATGFTRYEVAGMKQMLHGTFGSFYAGVAANFKAIRIAI